MRRTPGRASEGQQFRRARRLQLLIDIEAQPALLATVAAPKRTQSSEVLENMRGHALPWVLGDALHVGVVVLAYLFGGVGKPRTAEIQGGSVAIVHIHSGSRALPG